MFRLLVFISLLVWAVAGDELQACPGDTRYDKKCNHDPTHRVCARIGLDGTSFWHHTKQTSWCETIGHYRGKYGDQMRCPKEKPSWCICKWATAKWIDGEGCNDSVQFNCEATDVCNLKSSYNDYNVNLKPAHDCMAKKCKEKWDACPSSDEEDVEKEGAEIEEMIFN